MSEQDRRISWQSIMLIIAIVLPTLYFAGYPLLGPDDPATPTTIDRHFSHWFLSAFYVPMGVMEAHLRGTQITFHCDDPVDPYDFLIGP